MKEFDLRAWLSSIGLKKTELTFGKELKKLLSYVHKHFPSIENLFMALDVVTESMLILVLILL